MSRAPLRGLPKGLGGEGGSPALAPAFRPTRVLSQESLQAVADFRLYVHNRALLHQDGLSRRQVRHYQLYSRSSSKHLQVLPSRAVSASGEDGDKYGEGERKGSCHPLGPCPEAVADGLGWRPTAVLAVTRLALQLCWPWNPTPSGATSESGARRQASTSAWPGRAGCWPR